MPNYLPSLEERKLKMFEDVCATCGEAGDGGSGDSGMGGDEEQSSGGTDTLIRTLKMLSDKKKGKKKKAKEE